MQHTRMHPSRRMQAARQHNAPPHRYLSRMKLCTMAISLSISTASWLQSTSSLYVGSSSLGPVHALSLAPTSPLLSSARRTFCTQVELQALSKLRGP